jgi:4'-phosphopantetheinyl transferase
MPESDSHRIRDYFAARSRDITPVSAPGTVKVLFAPVSNDADFTHCCASILSPSEQHRAERFMAHDDRSLFIQRRAFRRFCGALSLGSSTSLSRVVFDQTANGRPYLPGLPNSWFSFSSCRWGYLGAWSSTHGIGVDIEDRTRDPGATDLARQYFSVAEARAVVERDGPINQLSFFQLWSLKEAALKSIGEGLPFGLKAFEFDLAPTLHVVRAPSSYGGPERFSAHTIIEGLESCTAIVIRNFPG